MRLISIVFLILVCTPNSVLSAKENKIGANDSSYSYFELAYTSSSFTATEEHRYLLLQTPRIAELSFGYNTFSQKNPRAYYNYPETGLSLKYFSLGNNEILGSAYVLAPYISYRLLDTKKIRIQSKFSFGISYVTQTYNENNNPENLLIGRHINAFGGTELGVYYKFNTAFSLGTTVAFSHISDGATYQPNIGINLISSSIALRYQLNESIPPPRQKTALDVPQKELQIALVLGRNHAKLLDNKKYWTGSLNLTQLWLLNYKNAVGMGLDVMYVGSKYRYYENEASWYLPEPSTITFAKENISLGTYLAYHYKFNQLTAYINIGLQVYKHYKEDSHLYERIGFRYKIGKHFMADLSLNANLLAVKHHETGIAYSHTY